MMRITQARVLMASQETRVRLDDIDLLLTTLEVPEARVKP